MSPICRKIVVVSWERGELFIFNEAIRKTKGYVARVCGDNIWVKLKILVAFINDGKIAWDTIIINGAILVF